MFDFIASINFIAQNLWTNMQIKLYKYVLINRKVKFKPRKDHEGPEGE